MYLNPKLLLHAIWKKTSVTSVWNRASKCEKSHQSATNSTP